MGAKNDDLPASGQGSLAVGVAYGCLAVFMGATCVFVACELGRQWLFGPSKGPSFAAPGVRGALAALAAALGAAGCLGAVPVAWGGHRRVWHGLAVAVSGLVLAALAGGWAVAAVLAVFLLVSAIALPVAWGKAGAARSDAFPPERPELVPEDAPGGRIVYPIWFVNTGPPSYAYSFDSAENAGMYIEALNAEHPYLPRPRDEGERDAVLDNLGRRVYMRIEFGEVLQIGLLGSSPRPEDLELMEQMARLTPNDRAARPDWRALADAFRRLFRRR